MSPTIIRTMKSWFRLMHLPCRIECVVHRVKISLKMALTLNIYHTSSTSDLFTKCHPIQQIEWPMIISTIIRIWLNARPYWFNVYVPIIWMKCWANETVFVPNQTKLIITAFSIDRTAMFSKSITVYNKWTIASYSLKNRELPWGHPCYYWIEAWVDGKSSIDARENYQRFS